MTLHEEIKRWECVVYLTTWGHRHRANYWEHLSAGPLWWARFKVRFVAKWAAWDTCGHADSGVHWGINPATPLRALLLEAKRSAGEPW